MIKIDKKLKRHIFECQTCDRLFITKASLSDHEVTHTDEILCLKEVIRDTKKVAKTSGAGKNFECRMVARSAIIQNQWDILHV